jgi:hypothetical protein
MASARTVAWVERLIWTLIYGGLFSVVIGLASMEGDSAAAWSLIVVGSLLAVVGVVLIWWRARLEQAR